MNWVPGMTLNCVPPQHGVRCWTGDLCITFTFVATACCFVCLLHGAKSKTTKFSLLGDLELARACLPVCLSLHLSPSIAYSVENLGYRAQPVAIANLIASLGLLVGVVWFRGLLLGRGTLNGTGLGNERPLLRLLLLWCIAVLELLLDLGMTHHAMYW
eukprot:6492574-Amphidinium_carterae.1